MQKKFQVFVSSTYTDLIEERQDILKVILDLSHIPSGMEGFFAVDEEQLNYLKRIIDECDYYILIIAGRYGSVGEDGISYTEKEYDYAVSKGITVLAFIHEDVAILASGKVEADAVAVERLRSFKERVSAKRLISYWHSREQLRANVTISLMRAIGEKPGVGWVRGDIAASEEYLVKLIRAQEEIALLKSKIWTLKNEMIPRVDNLASLEDKFPVRFSYLSSNGKRYATRELPWRAIFAIIGPSFITASSRHAIALCLARHIGETVVGPIEIFESDLDKIKIQLMAYNFMTVYSATTAEGRLGEFMQLTEFGRAKLIELASVKGQSSLK